MTDHEFVREQFPQATITAIEPLDLTSVFQVPEGVSAVQVMIHDRIGRAASLRTGPRFFIVRNSFIASFFRYLAIGSLYAKHHGHTASEIERLAIDRYRAAIRRTQAECMYARHRSFPVVSQYIEALIEDEQANREMYNWLASQPALEKSCLFLVEFTLEIILAHELAHCCRSFDRRHFDLVQKEVSECLQELDKSPLLTEEVECDVFALHVCIARHAQLGWGALEKCLHFAITAQFAYGAMIQDAESFLETNDPEQSYRRPSYMGHEGLPQARFQACSHYLRHFPFADDPLFQGEPTSQIEPFQMEVEWIVQAFLKLDDVKNEANRVIAQLLAQGFLSGLQHPFDAVAKQSNQEFEISLNQQDS